MKHLLFDRQSALLIALIAILAVSDQSWCGITIDQVPGTVGEAANFSASGAASVSGAGTVDFTVDFDPWLITVPDAENAFSYTTALDWNSPINVANVTVNELVRGPDGEEGNLAAFGITPTITELSLSSGATLPALPFDVISYHLEVDGLIPGDAVNFGKNGNGGRVDNVRSSDLTQLVTYPKHRIEREGNRVYGGGGGIGQSQTKHHWLYPADAFPIGTHNITEVRFRADESTPGARVLDFGNVRVGLTSTSIDSLSRTFADNYDDLPTVMYDAPLVLSSDVDGPSPHAFDYAIEFDEPFEYSPDGGKDLLLEFITSDGLNLTVHWDAHEGLAVAALNATARQGSFFTRAPVTQFVLQSVLLGDFNNNGTLDASDVDSLMGHIGVDNPDVRFDLTGDGFVSSDDLKHWVMDLKNTWFGDANLDGEFNSGDLVDVFGHGQFEDGIQQNSTWATGDWNGDGEFDSGDFVAAFQDGGFETGPRTALATVPEPSTTVLFGSALLAVCHFRKLR